MQSARSTLASTIAIRISARRLASSGKLRWQCESTYIERRADRRRCGSDRLRRLGRLQHRAERVFDLLLQRARLLVGRKLDADALCAAARGVRRRDPADLAGDRVALRIFGQRKQQVDVLAELVLAGGRDEQP